MLLFVNRKKNNFVNNYGELATLFHPKVHFFNRFDQGNTKKKLYGPFLWMGMNCLKARATTRRRFTFYHYVPRCFWYSFYSPQKNERLSRPWSHPVVLNTGSLDWESSALTTGPLPYKKDHIKDQLNYI